MSASLTRGVLTLSIDLASGESAVSRLVELLARYQISATWAITEPARSPWLERLGTSQELAISIDVDPQATGFARWLFGRELTRRVGLARAAGWSPSTLSLDSGELDMVGEAVARHGFVAVRLPIAAQSSPSMAKLHPDKPRFGLWSFRVSESLPNAGRRWLGGAGRMVRAWVERAVGDRGLCNVAISASALAKGRQSAWRDLERLLDHADSRRRAGLLEIETMAAVARRLTGQCTSKPSQSILRPAA